MSDSKDAKQSWDLKQVGTGAGSVAAIVFMLQSQGVNLMTQNQTAKNEVVIEKTIANTQRIERLEKEFSDMSADIKQDFASLRALLKDENRNIIHLFQSASKDRWTSTQQNLYEKSVEARFKFIEDRIELISNEFDKIRK
jgi:uncharacterized protein (UPF0335 family)